MTVVWAITDDVKLAIGVGILDSAVKLSLAGMFRQNGRYEPLNP